MPVVETFDEITPRSALRHRRVLDDANVASKRSIVTAAAIPPIQRASRSRPALADTSDDIAEWQRLDENDDAHQPKGHQATHPSSSTARAIPRSYPGVAAAGLQVHPLLFLGLGMLAMVLLWGSLSAAFGWLQTYLDDIHYGRPRTYQTDAWVGHNEQTGIKSHFIAINLNGHVEIIEIPGGDASHARIYIGPQLYGTGSDLVPVTIRFVDVNSDHLPDMLVDFQETQTVFINDQGGFRPPKPTERRQVEQFLQHMKV